MIHRQTLAELYLILKEEADVFEECIEKTEHKRYYTNSQKDPFYYVFSRSEKRRGTYDCNLYRETLTELFEIVKDEARNYDECLEREGRNKKSLFLL